MTDELHPMDDDDTELAERLAHERPTPSASFRSALHQRLVALEARGPLYTRPTRLWTRVYGFAASGAVLLALVGVGVAGGGPFAP
jgi:hypothetical protein